MLKNILLALATIASIVSVPAFASDDGYRYKTDDFIRNNVQVEMVIYPNQRELLKAADKMGATDGPGREIFGFTLLMKNENKCIIHMVDPAKMRNRAELGHEFLHCIRGRWHQDVY